MAQPSVAQYFNNRKRSATEDFKVNSARKILILDEESSKTIKLENTDVNQNGLKISVHKNEILRRSMKVINLESQKTHKPVTRSTKGLKQKQESGPSIQTFLDNMKVPERCITPPNPKTDNDLNIVKKKILNSSKLAELKQSIKKFKQSEEKLKFAEKKTNHTAQSPKLKTFKSIEFEVSVSPQKTQSPEKPYLSPKKESSVRRNLLGALSPSPSKQLHHSAENYFKETTEGIVKQGLKLPFKYKMLAEIFRAIDIVSQILYNRKEVITLRKLKSAVEEMLKRNLTEKHLAQIKCIYPDAFNFKQEKIKVFGTRNEEWHLVVNPIINNAESMTSEILLHRRRQFYEILIDLVKKFHKEFLLSLMPPIIIDNDKIARWHPEFDLEKVPEIESAKIPEVPVEDKFTTGREILEKARQMFNCNTRMEQALAKLKNSQNQVFASKKEELTQTESILKGIPKALLEKVRQKQAAKALMSMTRSVDKDKEIQMYSRLPEIARLTRNLFVSEKKSVLLLDVVVEKLGNSYRCFLNKAEIEEHLKAIANEVPEWLVFHNLRNALYLKLAKNADLSKILNKLEKLVKAKNEP